uniref:Copper transport protein n=1 Tax=Callithrix jacchus TaxID=9483 RepID=A0A8I4A2C0_CALJA
SQPGRRQKAAGGPARLQIRERQASALGNLGRGTWVPATGAPEAAGVGRAWGPQLPGARAPPLPDHVIRTAQVAIAAAAAAAAAEAAELIRSERPVEADAVLAPAPRTHHGGMALSVLVVLLLAVLYEGIKVGKAKLLHQVLVNLPTSISQQAIAETDGESAGSDSSPVSRTHHRYGQWVWERVRGLTLALRDRLSQSALAPLEREDSKAQGRTTTRQRGYT